MATESSKTNYILPADASEGERLDFQHGMLIRTFGLHQAPLKPNQNLRVLDLGCGTGNWAIDFAKQNPQADVVALDINEYLSWKQAPSNCKFKTGDIESNEVWAGLADKFDYIHARLIVVGVRDWPRLVQRCYERLTPSGWFELQDVKHPTESLDDDVGPSNSKFMQWGSLSVEATPKVGLDPALVDKISGFLSNAGFENVDAKMFKMFSGPWSQDEEERELGKMGLTNFTMGLHGFSHTLFTGVLGWTTDQHEKWLQETIKEIHECKFRTYLPMTVCIGQHL